MSDFCTASGVKARKEHYCCECNGIIAIGVRYMRIAGAQDGQGYSYKQCADCRLAFNWLDLTLRTGPFGISSDEGIEFGGLRSELAEYASESRFRDPEPLRHLFGMAERRRATELRRVQR